MAGEMRRAVKWMVATTLGGALVVPVGMVVAAAHATTVMGTVAPRPSQPLAPQGEGMSGHHEHMGGRSEHFMGQGHREMSGHHRAMRGGQGCPDHDATEMKAHHDGQQGGHAVMRPSGPRMTGCVTGDA